MTTLLFDIDGTLLGSGGSGQVAMEKTLQQVFGIDRLEHDIPAAGRTDKAIVTDLFQWHDIETSEENWLAFQKAYFEVLPETLAQSIGAVLKGAAETLQTLFESREYRMGLLTGNFEKAAWIKLRSHQLDHPFEFGAFGDHHHARDDVARDAWTRLSAPPFNVKQPESVWIIGDTPADIQCARAMGARVIAVATGLFEEQVLKSHSPDVFVQDLTEITDWSFTHQTDKSLS